MSVQGLQPAAPTRRRTTAAQLAHVDNWSDSYQRLPNLLEHSWLAKEKVWLKQFGQSWSSFDNVSHYMEDILDSVPIYNRRHIRNGWPIGEMMTAKERRVLDALPEIITIWRGCHKINRRGMCWSLNEGIAAKFPTYHRYRIPGAPALLVKGRVRKSDVIALKLDRSEQEVIVDPAAVRLVKSVELQLAE